MNYLEKWYNTSFKQSEDPEFHTFSEETIKHLISSEAYYQYVKLHQVYCEGNHGGGLSIIAFTDITVCGKCYKLDPIR